MVQDGVSQGMMTRCPIPQTKRGRFWLKHRGVRGGGACKLVVATIQGRGAEGTNFDVSCGCMRIGIDKHARKSLRKLVPRSLSVMIGEKKSAK
jgi:hypothetical protein